MNRKGFTLIELIIAVVITGILAFIIISNFLAFQKKARKEPNKAYGTKIVCLHPTTGEELYRGCALGNITGDKSKGYSFTELKSGKKVTTGGECVIREEHKECYISKSQRKK